MFSRKRADTANNATSPPPDPKSVAATGNWKGNDGKWSTFYVNVGDAKGDGSGQNFEVIPSTYAGITILPAKSSWCTGDCPDDRGVGTVNGNQVGGVQTNPDVSTWNGQGNYELATPDYWQNKTDKPRAEYGLTNLGIGQSSPNSWIAQNMIVGATTSSDFYLGLFGLGPGATNAGGGNGDVKSYLYTLQHTQPPVIPSLSYGYTAGAHYRNNGNGVYGSLVLGGYDEARINTDINSVSIRLPSDKNTTLVVGVQNIQYKPNSGVDQNSYGLTPSNTEGFMATIDSTFPYLVLPDSVCDEFAKRLNLKYDNKTNLYTTDSKGAAANDQNNGTITFKLGQDPSGTGINQTTINIPHQAFELEYFDPEEGSSDNQTKYFPIRKSKNGRYVLGRTFLQEAYIIVDYGHVNFTVAPAAVLDSVPKEKIVTIHDPSYVPPTPTPIPTGGSKGLSGGAIAGIVIGILAVALGIALGIFIWWKKRRARKATPPTYQEATEIDTAAAGNEVKHRRISELDTHIPGAPKTPVAGFYGADRDAKDFSPLPGVSEMESPPTELPSPPVVAATPHSEGSGRDYFTAGGLLGRRGATRESSTNNTPGTPPFFTPTLEPAELAADPIPKRGGGSVSKRDASASRSQNNIDEVMKRQSEGKPTTAVDGVAEEKEKEKEKTDTDAAAVAEGERRPSHTRGASDATVQSDITVVSQPTPEELERWADDHDGQPRRPLSE